jgi:hypothetical protein
MAAFVVYTKHYGIVLSINSCIFNTLQKLLTGLFNFA